MLYPNELVTINETKSYAAAAVLSDESLFTGDPGDETDFCNPSLDLEDLRSILSRNLVFPEGDAFGTFDFESGCSSLEERFFSPSAMLISSSSGLSNAHLVVEWRQIAINYRKA
jgi:hypothetical protein